METGNLQREIQFFSMIKNVVGKWKLMLLGGVAFSILFVGYSYMQNVKQNNQIKQAQIAYETKQETEQEEVAVSPTDHLSDVDVAFVDYYYSCKNLLEEQKDYIEQAPLMQLDANNFYKSTVTFYVNLDEVPEDEMSHVSAMVESYKALLREEDFNHALVEVLGGEEQAGVYYSEVIDGTNRFGNIINTPLNSGNFFVVAVYHQNEEMCKKIAQLVIDTVNQNYDKVQNHYQSHRLELISNNCSTVMDTALATYQKDQMDKLNNIRNTIKALSESMSDDAKIAIAAIEEETTQSSGEETEPQFNPVPFTIDKAKLLVAFVAGAFIMFVVAVFMYLYNTKVLWEDDMEKIFGLKVFGKFRKQKNGNDDEEYEFMSTSLQLLAKQHMFDAIYLSGEQSEDYGKELQERLKEGNLKVICGDYTTDHAASLKKAAEIGNVVLVLNVNKTKYNKVKTIMEQLSSYQIHVLGCIVVKN